MSRGARTGGVRTSVFEAERPRLVGLAYRMLGSYADAEDVVQEAWLRWNASCGVDRPAAWLTTVVTRLSLDRMRRSRRDRVDYVGPWLPEPVIAVDDVMSPEARAELADSLTFGFLVMLDELRPVERAVFLLAEVFAVPYREIAAAVGKSEENCRQIASRARRRLTPCGERRASEKQREVIGTLVAALAAGDVETTLAHLAPGVTLVADGGAAKRAARRPVVGAERVGRYLINLAARFAGKMRAEFTVVNGLPGVLLFVDDEIDLVAAFEESDERVAAIWIIRNPKKLERLRAGPGLV